MKSRRFGQVQNYSNGQLETESEIASIKEFSRLCQKFCFKINVTNPVVNFLKILKMDAADFWQQARTPFGLQTALHQYNLPTNQVQQPHHTLQHPISQEQLSESSTLGPGTSTLSNLTSPTPLPTLSKKPESSSTHLLQHEEPQPTSNETFRGSQQPADRPSTHLSSHHLLFNAAAAAAAAAHLKSTVMQKNHPSQDEQGALHNFDSRNNVGVIKPKQEMDVKPSHYPLDECRPQVTQSHSQTTYPGDFFNVGGAPSTDMAETSSNAIPTGLGGSNFGSDNVSQSNTQAQQQAIGGLQPPRCQALSPGQGGCPDPGTQTGPAPVALNKTLSQGHQSPQHSVTTSGGSSTPEIKYNNEKMANEIQLHLSRSSSAAAISERTLEECWSTLQRLFMHKSAMQQIQQQIPRVGLGSHGVTVAASLGGGNVTPGTDTKPHQCQQCMKSFSSNHQLVQHIRVHTGEKPYKCSYCDRRFKQLSHVQQHTRLHTGERPYKCHLPDCGRAFIQLSNLQQHLRNHDAQVERAKNRPFHCNICGKGFATESSLRTHTSKELQLHLGVLQQHAALIGGPNATSCPVCHKLFLGTEALVDHMKHVHKEKSPPPIGSAISQFNEINQRDTGSGNDNGHEASNEPISQCTSDSNCISTGHSTSGPHLIDNYLGKRRTANHPCPVCGKHYVNEGSLRKHLACHAETSQLTNSLRMWPCSVCQAVFTHENGLLTHMESMRMDPKHQFAAQYVLSRAAAEQRERESILAVTLAASSGASCGRIGIGDERNLHPIGRNSEGSNSKCPSPSVNSECSSNGRLSSSTASDQDQDVEQGLSENENSNLNNTSSTNNNNNCTNNNNCSSGKSSDLRLPSTNQYSMDTDIHVANRMSLMAAAAAAVAASRPQDGVDNSALPNAAVQAAVVNLAAAMRMNNPSNSSTSYQQHHGEQIQTHSHHQSHSVPPNHPQQLSHLLGHANNTTPSAQRSPPINVPSLHIQSESSPATVPMNINVHMIRGSCTDTNLVGIHSTDVLHPQQPQHHHQHQATNYSEHTVATTSQHTHTHPHHTSHQQQDLETTLRLQQAEAILRSHTEVAFRLVTGTGVKSEIDQQAVNGNTHTNVNSNQQHRFQTLQHEHQVPPSS
ncbi:hypothetical protein KR018_001479 [Drosophila ironensis]|nr:hypothetical protein KR018_001479 [Drosophila ironensis]